MRDKKIPDISDIRDESDRKGMRVVIEIKRDGNANVVLNQLLKHTQMETTFGVILLSLVDGRPRVLGVRDMLGHFIQHRKGRRHAPHKSSNCASASTGPTSWKA